MTWVLGVDPGGTTGYVLMDTFDGTVLDWGEERNQQEFLDFAWEAICNIDGLEVVCERWVTMRGRAFTNEPTAQEIIGALRWMCGYTHRVFHLQGAADAKAFGTKERLAEYREVGRGGGGHARMALSHVLLYQAVRRSP